MRASDTLRASIAARHCQSTPPSPTTVTNVTSARSEAITGFRRDHMTARSNLVAGRARIGSPAAVAAEIFGQSLGRGVPPPRVFFQAFQADGLQIARGARLSFDGGPAPARGPVQCLGERSPRRGAGR